MGFAANDGLLLLLIIYSYTKTAFHMKDISWQIRRADEMKFRREGAVRHTKCTFFFSSLLFSSLELSDAQVYEPQTRALPGTGSNCCEVVVLKTTKRSRRGPRVTVRACGIGKPHSAHRVKVEHGDHQNFTRTPEKPGKSWECHCVDRALANRPEPSRESG